VSHGLALSIHAQQEAKSGMLEFDRERVRANVREATTADLLDRATVYAEGMEPEALDVIEAELRSRGVMREELEAHAERSRLPRQEREDGPAARCSFCDRPAVERGWGWHRLWGVVPLFPRPFRYCTDHAARRRSTTSPAAGRPLPPG
jgi:hypothetical protein